MQSLRRSKDLVKALAFLEDAAGLVFGVRCSQHTVVRNQLEALKLEVAHSPVKRGQAPRPTIGHLAAPERRRRHITATYSCGAARNGTHWALGEWYSTTLTIVASARRGSTCRRMTSLAKSHTRRQGPMRMSASGRFACRLLLLWHALAGWQLAGSS